MNCEYCKASFKTKTSLNNHKIKAKYCLIIQGKKVTDDKTLLCDKCDKIFSSKNYLETHKYICKGKNIIEFKCEYCDKILSSKQNLETHTKKCETIKEEKVFKCIYCNKILSSKQMLENHKNICISKKDKEIEDKDKEIEDKDKLIVQLKIQNENFEKQEKNYREQITYLQDKLGKIAEKPTMMNNTTNNILNIASSIDFKNVNDIKKIIDDDYNALYALNGQKGVARFLVDKFLTDENGNLKYICTDPSRHIFKFKNDKGEIKKDIEAKKLTNYIIDGGIRQKINEVLKEDVEKFEFISNPKAEIHNIKNDNNSFKKELASITS